MTAFKKAPRLGRPSVLTEQLIADICNALRAGSYIETAAALAGITKETFYQWLKRGKAYHAAAEPNMDDHLCAELSDAVAKAMAEAEMRDLLVIDKHANGWEAVYERYPPDTIDEDTGKDISGTLVLNRYGNPIVLEQKSHGDWSAAAWRLERKYPKKWAKTEKSMEVDGHTDEDGSTTVTFVDPPAKKK